MQYGEPWGWDRRKESIIKADGKPVLIAAGFSMSCVTDAQHNDTRDRVVLAVNALAGIPDAHLPTLMQEVREVLGIALEYIPCGGGTDLPYGRGSLSIARKDAQAVRALRAKLTPKEPA